MVISSFIVILGLLLVIDIHFIGILPYYFWQHRRYESKEKFLYLLDVGRISSDCFTQDGTVKEIRGNFGQADSKLGVTASYIYIGVKKFSYHYRIRLQDISSIKQVYSRRFGYTFELQVNGFTDGCFIQIDNFTLSKKYKKELENIYSFISSKCAK